MSLLFLIPPHRIGPTLPSFPLHPLFPVPSHCSTPQTLESAISSSVRLCVVAPTVNVHLADSKIKMQSALPENSIRDFVVNEVLAKYTFLFKQVTLTWEGRWVGCTRICGVSKVCFLI